MNKTMHISYGYRIVVRLKDTRFCNLLCIFILCSGVLAQNSKENLYQKIIEQATKDYVEGQYQAVISSLEYASPQLAESVKPEAQKYLALSYAAIGNISAAKEHLRIALRLDPKMALDTAAVSPGIFELFYQVKKDMAREGAVCSCFIPGWGQMAKGETRKGCLVLGGSIATVVTSALLWLVAEDRHNDYLALGHDDLAQMDAYYASYDRWYKAALLSSTVCAGFYVYGFYDALSVSRSGSTDQYNDLDSKRIQVGYYMDF
jgi:tetratricopeptide (TPR) repeat protein